MKTKKRRRKDGKRYSMQTVIIKELERYVNIKVDFEARNVTRDKEGYFTLAPQDDNNPKCVCILKKKKKRALKYMEQNHKLKREGDKSTI